MKPKCEPLKWKLLNSIFRRYCSPYSTHFNILFTSRGRRPTCVISVPIPAKQTKTRKHKQHNGSSRQIKQASLLSKSYHTIRRAESFKYFTTKADEIKSDWKGQNRIHVFFLMTSCALTVHAISAASREGHPRVPETKRKVISVIKNLNYSYPQKFSFFITARHSWTNQKFSWFTAHKVTNKQCVK